MKISSHQDHSRFLKVTGLRGFGASDMVVMCSYRGHSNVHSGVAIDNEVMPVLYEATEMLQVLKLLTTSHRAGAARALAIEILGRIKEKTL